jgi:hypothetical protein
MHAARTARDGFRPTKAKADFRCNAPLNNAIWPGVERFRASAEIVMDDLTLVAINHKLRGFKLRIGNSIGMA